MKSDPAGTTENDTVLLHLCCAGCGVYPVEALREEGWNVLGTFWNPNIHPLKEYRARREAVDRLAREMEFRVIGQDAYGLRPFLRAVVFREAVRCTLCVHMRLLETAKRAKAGGLSGFTTTLLASTYMDHQEIRRLGDAVAAEVDVPFLYRDFRPGWKRSLQVTRALGLYRQNYCGCIYSEEEREKE